MAAGTGDSGSEVGIEEAGNGDGTLAAAVCRHSGSRLAAVAADCRTTEEVGVVMVVEGVGCGPEIASASVIEIGCCRASPFEAAKGIWSCCRTSVSFYPPYSCGFDCDSGSG